MEQIIVAKYREYFQLSPNDIDVIEQALRTEIAIHARVEPRHPDFGQARHKARVLNEVLGKLFNQKIFYSQVNKTRIPAA